MKRVLVTGSRDWSDWKTVYGVLTDWRLKGPIVVVHGDCGKGADLHAKSWAVATGTPHEPHPAIWRPYGIYNPQAGLVRNREMVELGADVCLAFIRNGSRGASHCAGLAEEAGIETRRFTA